jgi:uncharacterized protein (DUF2342 family)
MSKDLTRSVRAVADAASGGGGVVDWDAVGEAAKGATEAGDLTLSPEEEAGFADDVRAARAGLRETSGVAFDLPEQIEVQNRHHWIDANIETFSRLMKPLEEEQPGLFPGIARSVNTGTMAVTLSFLARNVLGQYDPLLLADGDDHGLYFVRPNVRSVAVELDVDYPRFRRWIAFHEVAHAAEFGAAPWLSGYLEDRLETGIDSLAAGRLEQESFRELNTAMTAVEGYAELLMDHAFDEEYADLRRKLDERRGGGDPLTRLLRRLLGMGLKRQQYERGAAFFEAVAAETDIETASRVWDAPENLPTESELDSPSQWLARIR